MLRVEIANQVGQNIRRLRQAGGKSLADLAASAELSKATLHAIERGAANPTLATLYSLATSLHVPLGELLDAPHAAVDVVRAAEGARVSGESVHARLIRRTSLAGSIELYDLRIDPVIQRSRAHLPGVEEHMFVTRGRVRCGPADEPVELSAGDAARYDASVAHIYEGLAAENRALLLMIHRSSRS
jgi:transcriptional regulator with XRE-family HTH domain